ncbi:MAG: bifunctional metallophosphatase/5'-nucleotidase [Chitinophagaceae bacterium]|nr:bifunctional metallophosphatase/5'-nucleotidase [Chitinophagaceae bacterium]
MKQIKVYIGIATVLFFFSCTAPMQTSTGNVADNGKITVQFVQINDVYEIAPIEAGKTGGVARVAAISKSAKAKNPNTFLVIAGDFLSPSVYNSLKYEGKRIRGRQMVDAFNAAGMDIAVFGNHEFDINEDELQSRINESHFKWISSNSFHKTDKGIGPFVQMINNQAVPFPETLIVPVKDADGTTAKIGFLGINIPFTKKDYVTYTDPLQTAIKLYNQIKDSCDAVVAITHQAMEDDIKLAKELPGLALILGGHEHDMRYQKVGNVIISKAHANARSVYELKLHINKNNKKIKTNAKLIWVNDDIVSDPGTDSVVKKWTGIADANFASLGFNAKRVVVAGGESFEAREGVIRVHATNFSRMLVKAMEKAAPQSQVAIVNAGSIRLDDVLSPPVTEYDIIRCLPFGGGITEVNMKGSLLIQVLEAGRKNVGTGGFLHYSDKLFYDAINHIWTINKLPVDAQKVYRVALSDFLLTGGEANMGFLTKDNKEIEKVFPPATGTNDPRSDIRLAIIQYLSQ